MRGCNVVCRGGGHLVVEGQDGVEVEGLLDVGGLGLEGDVGGAEHILGDVEVGVGDPWELQDMQS